MPRYGHKSDPHTHADEILMTASVGLTIFGTSRSSKRTSRGPYKTAPRMIHLLISISLCSDVSARCTHHLPRVPDQSQSLRPDCKAKARQQRFRQLCLTSQSVHLSSFLSWLLLDWPTCLRPSACQ